MPVSLQDYIKRHNYLICVNSDGCALHTMMPCLELVRNFADIAVITSAIHREWGKFGFLEHEDLVLCQDIGSKAHCIAALKKKGYPEENILIVGATPSDKAAAELNGVYYYPILVRREEESWQGFPEAVQRLRDSTYREYGYRKSEEFLINLSWEDT